MVFVLRQNWEFQFLLKELRHGVHMLKSLVFSSVSNPSFAIRVNLLHPLPSLFL